MTEKLYYKDSHLRYFTARVISCEPCEEGYSVVLNRTAFFPAGGGQASDEGVIDDLMVHDVFEGGDDIIHIIDKPLKEGSRVRCSIDWELRFRRMQSHSGEHIVSGTVHRLFGNDNTGFHMGENNITLDFSGELDSGDIDKIERIANMTVYRNLPVCARTYSKHELETLEYRSKIDIAGDVRIVSIEGVDRCACCAPHVKRTGEIGIIKILDSMRHRGGMRLSIVCGLDALRDYKLRCDNIREISEALSAKQLETAAAVGRVITELEESKRKISRTQRELLKYRINALKTRKGNIVIFEQELDMLCRRELVNIGMEHAEGICAVFSAENGNYNYIIGSNSADMRVLAKEINSALEGKGGGSRTMIQGTLCAAKSQIEDYFSNRKC